MTATELSLVIPTLEHRQDAMDYRRECIENDYWSPGGHIHGSGSLNRYESYDEWLGMIEKAAKSPAPDWVPITQYFGICNNKIIGTIQIRHCLNDSLLLHGGHIGYSVRPSERRKGFATKMLALALKECKKLGIGRVLITCDKNNTGSARTIQKNGGILENEIKNDDGGILQRYWIDIGI